jgi:hypothetical protein
MIGRACVPRSIHQGWDALDQHTECGTPRSGRWLTWGAGQPGTISSIGTEPFRLRTASCADGCEPGVGLGNGGSPRYHVSYQTVWARSAWRHVGGLDMGCNSTPYFDVQ